MRIGAVDLPQNDEKAKDKGGTRSGIERRQFVYTEHSPERRTGNDRRKKADRRTGLGRRRRDDYPNNGNPDDFHPVERRDLFRHKT
jgi:hypothetical protein